MKGILIGLGILVGLTAILFVIARITGAIQFYTAPTKANEPTIPLNDQFIISNLKKPNPFDFIAFNDRFRIGSDSDKVYLFVYRLVGTPGDVLEINNGVLFLNGINADTNLNLMHEYKVSGTYAAELNAEADNSVDSVYISMKDADAKKIGVKRLVRNDSLPEINRYFSHWWTLDNFGPLKVPEGYYFVLGDNRHDSYDSRLRGLIPIKNWKGTVLGH